MDGRHGAKRSERGGERGGEEQARGAKRSKEQARGTTRELQWRNDGNGHSLEEFSLSIQPPPQHTRGGQGTKQPRSWRAGELDGEATVFLPCDAGVSDTGGGLASVFFVVLRDFFEDDMETMPSPLHTLASGELAAASESLPSLSSLASLASGEASLAARARERSARGVDIWPYEGRVCGKGCACVQHSSKRAQQQAAAPNNESSR